MRGDSTYTDLGAMRFYSLYPSIPAQPGLTAINDSGQVVGYESVSGVNHAAIWDSVHRLEDLNTLYAGALPAGFVLNVATAINDQGYIVGYGTDSAGDANQMFLLQAPMAGDANMDGKVDINDLTKVLTNYNATGKTWNDGDFNSDGKVDINDLTIVLTQYNQSLSSSATGIAAVPEPGALILLAGGLSACWPSPGGRELRPIDYGLIVG